ncbi:hypothetical protein QFZ37_002906 [Chryseobacterium ginsenosidimutans]|uniref:hypothetical protein n=1 Tax=Chryseobacterium ginsenosidimutans TaxID=687846 RepID=UPI00278AC525|nr:hypothetical protein [Chryseobacterium ginsenosidimutans]MDQ0594537.1 hypothetical protein [Chryseobacterium ginsenosidimutans]
MKKNLILFFFLIGNNFTLLAQSKVEFKLYFSEIYATYDFLTKISENYPDNELKTIYTNSKYNTEDYKKQLLDFEKIRLNYTYSYDQYPLPLKVAMMSVDLLEKNLVTSQSVQEFKNKSMGIIPNEDLISLSITLEKFQPIYHELVAQPNALALEVQKNNLLNYVNNNQFSDFFQVGLSFYNTKWDKSIPFELNLLPSLDKGNLGARAFFNVAVCEASLGLKDHKTFFSVAMHEIYHIIYDNQSLKMKTNIQQWFNETNSMNSQYALLLLNEVLATALGNASIMENLNGKILEDDWYGNKYITEMSKTIYPTVRQYIESKKPIDDDFVKTYVHLYDTKFSTWNNELTHLFMYRYLVADTVDDLQYFRKTFPFYSNNRSSGNISLAEIEKAKDNPLTKVFIVSVNHKQKLGLLKNSFEELKKRKMNYKKEFIEIVTLKDRTKLFVINRHQSSIEDLMKKKFPNSILK